MSVVRGVLTRTESVEERSAMRHAGLSKSDVVENFKNGEWGYDSSDGWRKRLSSVQNFDIMRLMSYENWTLATRTLDSDGNAVITFSERMFGAPFGSTTAQHMSAAWWGLKDVATNATAEGIPESVYERLAQRIVRNVEYDKRYRTSPAKFVQALYQDGPRYHTLDWDRVATMAATAIAKHHGEIPDWYNAEMKASVAKEYASALALIEKYRAYFRRDAAHREAIAEYRAASEALWQRLDAKEITWDEYHEQRPDYPKRPRI